MAAMNHTPALDALREGYEVYPVVDAMGGNSVNAHWRLTVSKLQGIARFMFPMPGSSSRLLRHGAERQFPWQTKEVVMANWNGATIKEFHSKAGKGVGPFGDRLMLLTAVGARSGEERIISPVMYHRDGERYVVVASKGGAPDHPAWYHNLKANPAARVEVGAETGTETFDVRAREAQGKERERLFAERVAIAPGFGEYQRKTSRQIPVMILERTG